MPSSVTFSMARYGRLTGPPPVGYAPGTTPRSPKRRRARMPARLALVVTVLTVLVAPIDLGAAEKVTVALDFTLSGYHAPWFVAQDKGYFAEEGLDVNL